MKNKVLKKIENLGSLVNDIYGFTKVPEIEISYNLNSSRVLGHCQKVRGTLKTFKITLNEGLLEELGEAYIEDVVVHEYAHAVVGTRYPTGQNEYKKVKPHGAEFKAVCRLFGIEGNATTSIANKSKTLSQAAQKNNQRRWTYSCGCMNHIVTTTKHNKIQRGIHYSCVHCGNRLKSVQ